MSFNPNPYVVSTITAIGSLTTKECDIDLDAFFHSLTIESDADKDGVVFAEHTTQRGEVLVKGYHKKMSIVRRKPPSEKRFDKQVTVVLKHTIDGKVCNTNLKVFRKGNIQMTGVKTEAQGVQALHAMADCLRNSNSSTDVIQDPSIVSPGKFKICLINSDFRTGVTLRRDKLDRIVQLKYGTFCSFEPCIYPAVKMQFYYNEMNVAKNPHGTCMCSGHCDGKGTGSGDKECKKITIAVFGSGCVIITGAQTFVQLDIAYNFIVNLLRIHLSEIQIPTASRPPGKVSTK